MYPGQALTLEFPGDEEVRVDYQENKVLIWSGGQIIFVYAFEEVLLLRQQEEHIREYDGHTTPQSD
jgi:hypothetical protein